METLPSEISVPVNVEPAAASELEKSAVTAPTLPRKVADELLIMDPATFRDVDMVALGALNDVPAETNKEVKVELANVAFGADKVVPVETNEEVNVELASVALGADKVVPVETNEEVKVELASVAFGADKVVPVDNNEEVNVELANVAFVAVKVVPIIQFPAT